jgi:hypothetical protein
MQYGAEKIIKSWPKDSHDTTEIFLDKYGEPDEATPSFLIWYNRCMDDMCVIKYEEYSLRLYLYRESILF